jgi:hypothetical protein
MIVNISRRASLEGASHVERLIGSEQANEKTNNTRIIDQSLRVFILNSPISAKLFCCYKSRLI